jgi:hypothetical protein
VGCGASPPTACCGTAAPTVLTAGASGGWGWLLPGGPRPCCRCWSVSMWTLEQIALHSYAFTRRGLSRPSSAGFHERDARYALDIRLDGGRHARTFVLNVRVSALQASWEGCPALVLQQVVALRMRSQQLAAEAVSPPHRWHMQTCILDVHSPWYRPCRVDLRPGSPWCHGRIARAET